MLPFPELHAVSEKYFSEQLDQVDHPLIAMNPYFPFSPPPSTFAAESALAEFLLFSATTETNTALHPPPPPPSFIPNDPAATVNDAVSKRTAYGRESNRRKTSTRKDRHSKICTASGLRDRRMRLSRDVGHKFFNLQDKLGFDKPSKTVQWLLDMSESAIKELCKSASKLVFNSFSHQESPNDELCISELGEEASSISDSKGKSAAALEVTNHNHLVKKSKNKRSAHQTSKKAAINPTLKKESRDQARARARERTREKRRMGFLTSPIPTVTVANKDEEPISRSFNSLTCGDIYSQSNKQHMKLIDERNSGLQVSAGGIGLKPMLDYSNQTAITSSNDTFYIFQEQWDMERAFLADVHFYSRAS